MARRVYSWITLKVFLQLCWQQPSEMWHLFFTSHRFLSPTPCRPGPHAICRPTVQAQVPLRARGKANYRTPASPGPQHALCFAYLFDPISTVLESGQENSVTNGYMVRSCGKVLYTCSYASTQPENRNIWVSPSNSPLGYTTFHTCRFQWCSLVHTDPICHPQQNKSYLLSHFHTSDTYHKHGFGSKKQLAWTSHL